jgi:hypothetical protein
LQGGEEGAVTGGLGLFFSVSSATMQEEVIKRAVWLLLYPDNECLDGIAGHIISHLNTCLLAGKRRELANQAKLCFHDR